MLFALGLIYISCRHDITPTKKKDSKITTSETWFNSYINKTSISPIFKNTRYHWDKANIFTYKNGFQAITVPVTEINQNPDYSGKRTLYLYPWKNGKGYYTTIFEFLPDDIHLKKHKGKIDLLTFDGIIASWNLEKGFSAGIQYKNGVIGKRVNIMYRKRNQVITQGVNSTLPNVTVTGYIPASNWGFFWISLIDSFGFSTSILWGGGVSNPCEYTNCNNANPYTNFDPNAFIEPDNNDDQDGKAEIMEITNNINDPCLKATLNNVIDDDIVNKISDILQNTFRAKNDFNINFQDENLNNSMLDGRTNPFFYGTGRIDFNITLNAGVLIDASKEYTAATIYHEIIHAYLITLEVKGQNLHHIYMTEQYVSQLENSLHSLFPNISNLDAKALSWGGLTDTPAWLKFKTDNPLEAQNLEIANSQHRIHSKGTPCN